MSTANVRIGKIHFQKQAILRKFLTAELNFALEIFANSTLIGKFPSNENYSIYDIVFLECIRFQKYLKEMQLFSSTIQFAMTWTRANLHGCSLLLNKEVLSIYSTRFHNKPHPQKNFQLRMLCNRFSTAFGQCWTKSSSPISLQGKSVFDLMYDDDYILEAFFTSICTCTLVVQWIQCLNTTLSS